jgi:predicted ATPase
VVFNPLTAKLAEAAGFAVIYLGGGTLGYVQCVTEANLTLTEMVRVGLDIRTVCHLPLASIMSLSVGSMISRASSGSRSGYINNFHHYNCLLAEAYMAAGRIADGLTVIDESIVTAERLHLLRLEAELHRYRGELMLSEGQQSEAENSMRRAIAISQRQEARSWELRATTSLARLLRDTNRSDDARTMLAEIYNWFTEGVDTADLKEAKALLDELNG